MDNEWSPEAVKESIKKNMAELYLLSIGSHIMAANRVMRIAVRHELRSILN